MTDSPIDSVRARLLEDEGVEPPVAACVEAALTSNDAFAAWCRGVRPPEREGPARSPGPARAALLRLDVEGFRGIGPRVTLDLDPGPGLTVIVGRNGSGKSSLADALELGLTGAAHRFERGPAWRDGWRNLHTDGPTRIVVTLAVEGRQPVRITRTLDGSSAPPDLPEPGWDAAVATHRPFLSYGELSALLDSKPAVLFDRMDALLGLGAVTAARDRIRDERLRLERFGKEARKALPDLCDRLRGVDDPRARTCLAALQTTPWDLDTVQAVLDGTADRSADPDPWSPLAQVAGPDLDAAARAVVALREAREALRAMARSSAERSRRHADLLDLAVAVADADAASEACPVCETPGVITEAWRARVAGTIQALREEAAASEAAHRAWQQAVRQARALVRPAPAPLSNPAVRDVTAEARAAWARWATLPADESLADHLEATVVDLVDALARLRDHARTETDRRRDIWRELARPVAAWLPTARAAADADARLRQLRAAEAWLKATEADLRQERFGAIRDQACRVWETLRRDSNVSLESIALKGVAGRGRREVLVDVHVDGSEAPALGVMSQGELNALALALFLPRLTAPESPFGFVVIDDPVQSMDPHKVDGLAQVLHHTAQTHQVVVMTHDDRLAEALRRLQIPARILEVQRRARSVVEILPSRDPVDQYIVDALSVARAHTQLGRELPSRVVPGLCRSALEAAMTHAIRRRRLSRGARHHEVEEAIADARTSNALAALALFDDPSRGGEVLRGLANRWGRQATDTYNAVRKGAHGLTDVGERDLVDLIRSTERLARQIESLA